MENCRGYVKKGDLERILEMLEGWIEQNEERVSTIIGGENARTGKEGGIVREMEGE